MSSVEVIVRRKDKKLEPYEPPKKNIAQMRVNMVKKATDTFKKLSKKNFERIKKEVEV